MKLGASGEPDAVKLQAAQEFLNRAYGKPPAAPEDAGQSGVQVNVVSAVGGEVPRPLLPDGRDPFDQPRHSGAPDSGRPIGRAPVSEPPQHRLFEGEPEPHSAPPQFKRE